MNWIADIVIGVLALIGTLGGAYFANRKSTALVVYRLQELEKKVDKHNQVIERTYALEERVKAANHRIDDLEKK